MASDELDVKNGLNAVEADPGAATSAPARRKSGRLRWVALVLGVLVFDIVAFMVVPPFVAGSPETAATYPADFITATFHFPPPAPIISLDGSEPPHGQLIYFHPSISNTIPS